MKAVLLFSLVLLSACTAIQTSKTYQGVYNGGREGLRADSKPLRFKLAKFIYSDEEPAPQPPPPKQKVYCYKTIADSDCYKEPLVGEEERLME